MAKLNYHTNSIEEPPEHRQVYHNDTECYEGKKIKPKHWEYGTGDKPLCDVCKKL